MINHDLINKIKVLKEIRPDEEWKESNRVFLLSKCRSESAVSDSLHADSYADKRGMVWGQIWQMGRLFRFRPAMAAVLVIIFTITGCAFTLNISQMSLPGEMLWSVKISLENARTTFSSGEKKVKLEAELAGKRLEELRALPLETDPKVVAQAVHNFKIHINEAKEGLKELDEETSEKVTSETYAAITKAEDESQVWEEDLIKKIEGRIEEVKGDSEVKDLIREAEVLLEEGKLGEGGKLVEALILLDEVDKILEAKKMIK